MAFNQTSTALPQFDIGVGTYGIPKVLFEYQNLATLKIGKFCSIAEKVEIFLGGSHNYKCISTFPFDVFCGKIKNTIVHKVEDVIICNDVWIGHGVTILPGVTIADGCVIGTNSTIRDSILEPYSIVIGNPQQTIKKRFSDSTIQKLMEIKWWDFPLDFIIANRDELLGNDIDLIVEIFKR